MTNKQQEQFNNMLGTLKKIAQEYQTPDQLRRNSKNQFGLDYEEALEMAYENIQNEARCCAKGIRKV